MEGTVRHPPHRLLTPHGNEVFNEDVISVVDDAVHDCLRNRAAGIRVWVNTCIPALGLVLGAEDHGTLAEGLHNFQQIIGLLRRGGRISYSSRMSRSTFCKWSGTSLTRRRVQCSVRPEALAFGHSGPS